jgi:dihydrofolate reductase
MRKLILLAQISTDGFVAGRNGEFDNFIDGESLEFVCSLTEDADAALFGRKSYELLESYWPTAADKPNASEFEIKYSEWYNKVPKYVLSRTIQFAGSANTRTFNENIVSEIHTLKSEPGKNILIFGSPSAVHTLLQLNLIDGIWLIIHPVLFGTGISLFKDRDKVTKLQLSATKNFPNGLVAVNYSIPHEG